MNREALRQDIIFSMVLAEENGGPIVIKKEAAKEILKLLEPYKPGPYIPDCCGCCIDLSREIKNGKLVSWYCTKDLSLNMDEVNADTIFDKVVKGCPRNYDKRSGL